MHDPMVVAFEIRRAVRVWWFEPWATGEGCWACGRPR